MLKFVGGELGEWLSALAFSVPGKLGQAVRYFWCSYSLKHWGHNSRASHSIIFSGKKNISVGRECHIGPRCFFAADKGTIEIGDRVTFNTGGHFNASIGGNITIHNDCLIGPNVVLHTAPHKYENPDALIKEQGHSPGDITIEEGAWVASNAIIFPNVVIGRGAVIGAGSVVTKSVEPMSISYGNPARLIRFRGEKG